MKDISFTVEHLKFLSSDVFELKLKSDEKLPPMRAGQFLNLQVPSNEFLLRRPFCLYKFDTYSVTLIIAVVGRGTKAISALKCGDKVKAVIPLGNGFTLEPHHKKVAIIGGGIGCAPLLSVMPQYPDREFKAYLGFSTKQNAFFENDFKSVCETVIATDDGTHGIKGYVTDVFKNDITSFKPDIVLTCGPEIMLKALAKITNEHKIPAFMSGEARMACGVGACLVCTCGVKQKDGTVRNLRACADGPVFSLEDVIL